MERKQYSLTELAGECEIEPRTIRSYFASDLLSGAEQTGRGRHYTRYHVDRLKVIGMHRKARDLPLKEIRRIMRRFKEEEIRRIAAAIDTNQVAAIAIIDTEEEARIDGTVEPHEPDESAHERILRELQALKKVIEDLKRTIEERL